MNLTGCIWVIAGVLLLLALLISFSNKKSVAKQHHSTKNSNEKKKGVSWWNRPLGSLGFALGLGLAIFLALWALDEFGYGLTHANEGSGIMTYNGTQIKVSKLSEDEEIDLAKLTRYSTPGEGEELRFLAATGSNVNDIELYVVVVEKNDRGEIAPAVGHEPILYKGQALNKCGAPEYALYLGPKSKVQEVTIIATVDTAKTCNPLNGKLTRK